MADKKERNIFQKMEDITVEIGTVAKGLDVSMGKGKSYKAVSERDILDAVKPIEAKHGVYSYPVSRKIIESDTLVRKNQYGDTQSLFMRLEVVYRFVNVDNPTEFIEITSYGDGIDTGDKATGKAMTYADKYALMKAYKISTGEDPDSVGSPNHNEQDTYVKMNKATSKQIKMLTDLGAKDPSRIVKMLEYFKVEKIEDLTTKQASQAIQTLQKSEH